MRMFFISAALLLSVVLLAACAAAAPSVPAPAVGSTETPGPVLTAQASTDLQTTSTPADNSGGLAVAVSGVIISTPLASDSSMPTATTIVLPSPSATTIASPTPIASPTSAASPTKAPPTTVSSPTPKLAPPIATATRMAGTPVPIPVNGPLTVTLADAGKTIKVPVGGGFLLALGEGFEWEVTIDDQSIISRQVNITVVRGAQGVYNAHKAGTTILHAVGSPTCRSATPPCAAPSRSIDITIVVS